MSAPTTTPPQPTEGQPAHRDVTPPPPSSPPSRPAGGLALGSVLVAIGTLWLLSTLDVSIPLPVVGPALLILIGIGIAVSAVRGEPDGGAVGLIGFLGFLLAVAVLLTTAFQTPFGGGVGDQVHTPRSIEQLDTTYRLFAGTLTVDLREVSFPEGTTAVEVSTVLGEARVLLPAGVAVSVDGRVAAGSTDVLGTQADGIAVSDDRQTSDWDTASRRVEVRGRVGLGQLLVTR